MTGIYATNFATNFEIVLDPNIETGSGLKINLKPTTASIVLKKSSKEIQFPA